MLSLECLVSLAYHLSPWDTTHSARMLEGHKSTPVGVPTSTSPATLGTKRPCQLLPWQGCGQVSLGLLRLAGFTQEGSRRKALASRLCQPTWRSL